MKIRRRGLIITLCVGCFLIILSITGISVNSRNKSSCDPFNVFLSKTGENNIEVSWKTKGSCLGYVLYGESSYEIERVAVNADNLGKNTDHKVKIGNLLSTNSYYFVIVSGEEPYGNNGKPIAFSLMDL